MTSANRRDERRDARRHDRRQRRGGEGRGPVAVQRAASTVVDAVDRARYRAGRAVRGDRPLVVMLVGALTLGIVLLSGPAQSYLDARARVETLETKAAALDTANERLRDRAADLQDPLNVELLAREQQGFVRPGEVPYTVVPPEVARPRIAEPLPDTPDVDGAWYRRAWATLDRWLS